MFPIIKKCHMHMILLLYHRSKIKFTLWITPRLAVAVNLAQLVALASHSKFSLKNNRCRLSSVFLTTAVICLYRSANDPRMLPEKLVTCRSRVHEWVCYDCRRVAHWISHRILKRTKIKKINQNDTFRFWSTASEIQQFCCMAMDSHLCIFKNH